MSWRSGSAATASAERWSRRGSPDAPARVARLCLASAGPVGFALTPSALTPEVPLTQRPGVREHPRDELRIARLEEIGIERWDRPHPSYRSRISRLSSSRSPRSASSCWVTDRTQACREEPKAHAADGRSSGTGRGGTRDWRRPTRLRIVLSKALTLASPSSYAPPSTSSTLGTPLGSCSEGSEGLFSGVEAHAGAPVPARKMP